MEEIIRLSSKKLNASEEILYTNINGAVVKYYYSITIILIKK